MSTLKQQIAVRKAVENGGNITKAMRDAGYCEATVNNPSNLTNSTGFKRLLRDEGLTERLILRSLIDDIKHKRGKRLGELSLGAELLGMKKTAINIANEINIDNSQVRINPEFKRRADEAIEQYLKETGQLT